MDLHLHRVHFLVIIIIIKSIYIAQSRYKAANALYEQLHVEQKCLQFVPERCQCNVWCSQCSRKTVPYTRSLDGETAVAVVCSGAWNSQSAGVSGSKTPGGNYYLQYYLLSTLDVPESHPEMEDKNYVFAIFPDSEISRFPTLTSEPSSSL